MLTTKKKAGCVSCVEIQIFIITFIAILAFLLGKEVLSYCPFSALYFSNSWADTTLSGYREGAGG